MLGVGLAGLVLGIVELSGNGSRTKIVSNLGQEIFRLLVRNRLGLSADQYPWLLIENPGI